jgi:endonuclease YncB( thermonuclease family)
MLRPVVRPPTSDVFPKGLKWQHVASAEEAKSCVTSSNKAVPKFAMLRALIGVVAVVAWPFPTGAETLELRGRVVRISDGDTLKVLAPDRVTHVIRISAIDAPERGQPFGRNAQKQLAKLTYQQSIVARCHKADRYRRLVCNVRTAAVPDVGHELIKQGGAWHFKKYEREQPAQDAMQYALAENLAREARIGLWSGPRAVAPWDWRAGSR